MQLKQLYNCAPVFIDQDVKDKYYKGAAATSSSSSQQQCSAVGLGGQHVTGSSRSRHSNSTVRPGLILWAAGAVWWLRLLALAQQEQQQQLHHESNVL
jgi:hypothetical protein